MTHSLDIRVYYEDTDAGGIVFYANYLKFTERARTEYLRSMGFENKSLREDSGVLIVVRHVDADYHRSAELDDVLTVKTSVDEMKNSSFTMQQSIFCNDRLLFEMKVRLVCVGQDKKPTRIPDDLKQALEAA